MTHILNALQVAQECGGPGRVQGLGAGLRQLRVARTNVTPNALPTGIGCTGVVWVGLGEELIGRGGLFVFLGGAQSLGAAVCGFGRLGRGRRRLHEPGVQLHGPRVGAPFLIRIRDSQPCVADM